MRSINSDNRQAESRENNKLGMIAQNSFVYNPPSSYTNYGKRSLYIGGCCLCYPSHLASLLFTVHASTGATDQFSGALSDSLPSASDKLFITVGGNHP